MPEWLHYLILGLVVVVLVILCIMVYKLHSYAKALCIWTSEVTGLFHKVDWNCVQTKCPTSNGGVVPAPDPKYP